MKGNMREKKKKLPRMRMDLYTLKQILCVYKAVQYSLSCAKGIINEFR